MKFQFDGIVQEYHSKPLEMRSQSGDDFVPALLTCGHLANVPGYTKTRKY
jgi:hypothetical protein